MVLPPETDTEPNPPTGGLIRIRKVEPICSGAAFLRNIVNGFRLEKGNQGIPDGVLYATARN